MRTQFLVQTIRRWTHICLGCIAVAFLPAVASAATATTTWTGAVNANWATTGNWSGGVIPGNQNLLTVFNGAAANGNRTINIAGTARNTGGARFDSSGASGDGFTFTTASSSIAIRISIDGIVNNDDDAQNYRVPVVFNSTGGTAANGLTAPINATSGSLNFNINAFAAGGTLGALSSDGNGACKFAFNAGSGNTITIGSASTPGIISGANGLSITKDGLGSLILNGTAANTYSGSTTINAGSVTAGKVNALGSGSGALTVNGGTLDIGANNQSVGAVVLAGGTIDGSSGILTGTSYGLRSGTVSAKLGGASAALTKTTGGTATLTGVSTYGGNTTISAGTLALSGSGSIANSPNIILNGGTLDVSGVTGGFSLLSGQTLKGNGSIVGGVTANGTMSPGASIGTLNLNSSLTLAATANSVMEINHSATPQNADLIAATSITLGGTLTISDIGSGGFLVGDVFNLFDGSLSSAFASIVGLPALDPSMQWDTSGLMEAGNGELRITAVPEPSAVACLGLGIAALCMFRRRK
jgi:autotransporter-associated beta strand protein